MGDVEQCGACHAELGEGARFCPACGTPVEVAHGPPNLTGQRVGNRYEVTELLVTHGGYRAHRAEDPERLGPVRLIAFHPQTQARAAVKDAARAADVRHPGVLTSLGMGRHGKVAIVVEPWCEATPLAELLAGGPMQPMRATHLALDLLAGLAALHAAGVVHGVVDPLNVLVDRDWAGRERARLAAVGSRHAVAYDLLPGSVAGVCRADLRHAAPELFAGADPAPQTDIYQVGLLLAWMLTGESVAQGEGFPELSVAHLEGDLPPLDDVEPRLAAFVHRCLARAPADRYGSAAEASRALRRLPEPLPVVEGSPDEIDAEVAAREEAEDWAGAAEALLRKVGAIEDRAWQAATLFQLAELYEERLDDRTSAAQAFERVLDRQPDDFDAFDRLAALYEDAGERQALLGLLLDRARWSHDPSEHVELHERAADLIEDDDAPGAFVVLGRGFERTGDDAHLGERLLALAERAERTEALIDLYEGVIDREPNDAPDVHLRLAGWCEGRPALVGRAVHHLQRYLRQRPEDTAARDRLEQLLEQTGRWPVLIELLRARVKDALDPYEKAELLVRVGAALEALDETAQAAEARQEALRLGADGAEEMDALAPLLTRLGRWAELADLLGRRVEKAQTTAERVGTHLRTARLYREQLDDEDRALKHYLAILEVEPDNGDALGPAEALLAERGREKELGELYRRALPTRPESEREGLLARLARSLRAQLDADPDAEDVREELVATCWSLLEVSPKRPEAVVQLDALYRSEGKWSELAVVYGQHTAALGESPRAVDPFKRLAAIQRDHLDERVAATESYEAAVRCLPDDTEAVQALADLYERAERWEDAVRLLGREVHWPDDPTARMERWCRIGRILLRHMTEPSAAEQRFREVLLHSPGHGEALDGLAELYEGRDEWDALAAVLRARADHAASQRAFGAAMERLGEVLETHLGDRQGGLAHYEQAVEVDTTRTLAAARLAEAWRSAQRWTQARRMYGLVLQGRPDAPPAERLALHLNISLCAEADGDHDLAFAHYRAAFELDGKDRAALLGMSRQLFRRQQWERALSVYQTLVLHHRDTLDAATKAEVLFRQGMIKQIQGASGRAEAFFERTLAEDPRHREALQGLAALYEEEEEWSKAVDMRRRLIDASGDDGERAEHLLALGDLLGQRLNDAAGAAEAFEAARAVTNEGPALERLLAVAKARQDWSEVAWLSLALAEGEPHVRSRARRAFYAGEILRDRLGDREGAAAAFEKALDAEPGRLEAFRALDDLLADNPVAQKAAVRRMLERATVAELDDVFLADLARRLGEMLTADETPADARRAFGLALSKRPDDPAIHEDLAALLENQGEVDEALTHTWRLIELAPGRLEAGHRLYRLLRRSGDGDGAWCVAHALAFRGLADADEAAFHAQHRGRQLAETTRALGDEAWDLIEPTEKSKVVDQLMLLTSPYALPSLAEAGREFLDAKAPSSLNLVLGYAAQTLFGLDPPTCVRGDRPGLNVAMADGPALAVGPGTEDLDLQQLAFLCGRALYLLAQQHVLAALDETPTAALGRLRVLVRSLALRMAPFDQMYDAVDARAAELLETLDRDAAGEHDLRMWLSAMQRGADRVGLLMAGDLDKAASLIPEKHRIDALVAFSVSPPYLALRRAAGLVVETA